MFFTTVITPRLTLNCNRAWNRQLRRSFLVRTERTGHPHYSRSLSTTSLRLCEGDKSGGKGPPTEIQGGVGNTAGNVGKAEHKEPLYKVRYENPISRTLGIMGDDVKEYFSGKGRRVKRILATTEKIFNGRETENEDGQRTEGREVSQRTVWPSTCDVLIIGGGAMGSSIAYHLKERALKGLHVVVVEQDYSYKRASTVLSVGGIRQQFSIPENIHLSLYGMDFLRNAPKFLAVEGADPPDMQFNPGGYLTLASEEGVENMKANFDIQREVGAKVEFLSAGRLKKRFPWINTEGIAAGVIGLENEGWFDPWSFLCCLRRKAVSLGTEFVTGKVTGLDCEVLDDIVTEGIGNLSLKNIRRAEVTLPDGEKRDISCAIVILAAGAWSGEIGNLVGIGQGSGVMGIPIPIEPRKRYVYCIHAPDGPGLDCPLVINPDHSYFRREGLGGLYLCGQSPTEAEEPPIDDLEVDENYFQNRVWPAIAQRVPAFENAKLRSSWAGYYDYNTFDQNGIIGLHPMFSNLFLAAGFSGHGIQQAAGIGRAVMESILHGEYMTINLERFAFERILMNEPLLERYIV
ncbi:FAD-dependent oxidoreductase domain-containing protein 1-like [Macrobrachium rosenbergii]|uniref:FAD-dependent oxidoreductase domain-containing protein 1-like n=1 Tax=Macrobrachium rosenbergii TaxID=79674 RepID=UPI0034D5EBB6